MSWRNSCSYFQFGQDMPNSVYLAKFLSFGDEKFSSREVTFVNPSSSIIERTNVSLAFKRENTCRHCEVLKNRESNSQNEQIRHCSCGRPIMWELWFYHTYVKTKVTTVPHYQLWRDQSHDRGFIKW